MRPMIRVVTALAFAFVSTLPSARAGDADTEFDAFLARWRAAVAANDVDAVVAMTRLPFLFEGREHAREGVAREVVPALLTVEVRHCLRTAAPLREDDRMQPINPYGRSKAMAEVALKDISDATGLGVGVLRYFNAAGADPSLRSGQASRQPHHLIEIATRVLTGQDPRLTIFGTDYPTRDGTAVRDYVHVRDIAAAHILLMDRLIAEPAFRTYNVGSGEGATVREVVDTLSAVARRPIPQAEGERRAGDPAVLVADSSRLRRELGWKPRHESLAEIVRHALLWERARSAMASRSARRPAARKLAEL